jgi:hypothetical protein
MSARLRLLVVAFAAVAVTAVGLVPATASVAPMVLGEDVGVFAPQLVTVHTPTRADKDRLLALGLDATEHAGHDYIEVVLHGGLDEDVLRDAGFTWDVRIADLIAREAERIQLDAAYAEAVDVSPLPSGRDAYRVLDDFGAEIDALAAANPDLAKRISIGESVEGRDLTGIELAVDVHAPEDGRPVFLMFGAHHAREWPSAELPMEFAHDLVRTFNDPTAPDHERVVDLLTRGRAIIVPVSNPDGYDASRTTGDIIDLNILGDDNGPLYNPGILIGTPGNAYKRKNCRYVDGQTQPAGTCVAVPSPGGFGTGVDLNRNYGALWGGPGADDVPASATYHGPAPFSEPETQAIRSLISTRQVTTVITNHTFSNLILRPVGVQPSTIAPDGFPMGFAPDECFTDPHGHDVGMQALGERMAAQNGYSNQFGWELYDTTGTTEDYSYNATGGYGYTFEIGPNEFHPPFEQVVGEYVGDNPAARGVQPETAGGLTTAAAADCDGADVEHEDVGGGNREAFLVAFENAVDERTHSLLTGTAPAGATLSLTRSGVFPLWDGTPVGDTVATSMVVGEDGAVEWHVNPSTRPFVASRIAPILSEAVDTMEATGFAAPSAHLVASNNQFVVSRDVDLITATVQGVASASGIAADLNEHHVKLLDPAGREVASATGFGASNSLAWTGPDGEGVPAGTYTVRVDNYLNPGAYTVQAATYDIVGDRTPGQVEAWQLSCVTADGVTSTRDVVVDRGQAIDLGAICG